jgi:hypothetical protein
VQQAAEVAEAVSFTEGALVKLNEDAEGMAARLAHWEERPPGDHGDYHRLRLLFEYATLGPFSSLHAAYQTESRGVQMLNESGVRA